MVSNEEMELSSWCSCNTKIGKNGLKVKIIAPSK
jgi:hypothetical protein